MNLPAAASKLKESTLPQMTALIAADMKAVDALILGNVENDVALISNVARHLISSGGKRLRPALVIASSKLCGYSGDKHIGLAACVEFIHTATLLHDDVVDDSHLRRGRATANDVWGNKASVLVGDFLLGRAFQMMVKSDSLRVLQILSDASATIAEGEVLQLMLEGELSASEEQYTRVISAKTAELFAAACELGAVLGGNAAHEAPMRDFGMKLGIAFQLVDDALDYVADERTLGKNLGDDFRESKITLPIITAIENANAEEKDFWQRTLAEGKQVESDLTRAVSLIQKYKGVEATMLRAKEYCNECHAILSLFPASAAKDALAEAVDFCLGRAY